MRKYQAIWLQLKKTSECTLVAHPSLHRRIRKAVTKEKWKDISYKVQWDMLNEGSMLPELVMETAPDNPNLLLIKLIVPITLADL